MGRGGSLRPPGGDEAAPPKISGDSNRKPVIEIDGRRFETLEGFYDEVSRQLIPGSPWGRNLDAFHDILRGGFGTPEGGFLLAWKDHERSRETLGHEETARQLVQRLARCHPTNRPSVRAELEAARRHEGATVFDWLVEILRAHGPDGTESIDGIELLLQ